MLAGGGRAARLNSMADFGLAPNEPVAAQATPPPNTIRANMERFCTCLSRGSWSSTENGPLRHVSAAQASLLAAASQLAVPTNVLKIRIKLLALRIGSSPIALMNGRTCEKRKTARDCSRAAEIAGLDGVNTQRLENWKLRRALALPYFLRSTTRLSRVRKPPFLSTARSSGSIVGQRLGDAVAHRAGLAGEAAAGDRGDDVVLVLAGRAMIGCCRIICSTGRAKKALNSLPLTVILPLPGLIQTRAMAFLRLPVA